jgi:hypothetical protein
MPNTDLDRFTDDLVFQLRLQGYSVFRFQLRPWVEDCWSLIESDPSPAAWARRWIEAQRRPAGAD